MALDENMIARLRELAGRKTAPENAEEEGEPFFNPGDTGNFDDTYAMGTRDGETALARELLSCIQGGASA